MRGSDADRSAPEGLQPSDGTASRERAVAFLASIRGAHVAPDWRDATQGIVLRDLLLTRQEHRAVRNERRASRGSRAWHSATPVGWPVRECFQPKGERATGVPDTVCPVDRHGLTTALNELGVDPRAYSLNGGLLPEKYCLDSGVTIGPSTTRSGVCEAASVSSIARTPQCSTSSIFCNATRPRGATSPSVWSSYRTLLRRG